MVCLISFFVQSIFATFGASFRVCRNEKKMVFVRFYRNRAGLKVLALLVKTSFDQ